MSNRSDIPCSEEMSEYYDGNPDNWPVIQVIPPTPYVGSYSPYTEPLTPSTTLTPISLPDTSFGPGPAISHHSQGYSTQGYQYGMNNHMSAPVGLGISVPFPSDYPLPLGPNPSFVYAPEPIRHTVAQAPSQSAQGPPPAKRARHPSSDIPSHDQPSNTPVSIAPNPEGLLRMEQDRQHTQPSPHILPRIRAPGRGRRDPQAEEEDAFVEELRENQTAWKVVRQEFRKRFDKDASEARLQMRLHRRLRERMVRWEESDVTLLIRAHGIWAKDKFHYISDKMKELGGTRLYSPDQCRTQLRLLDAKNQLYDRMSESPSAMSDPAPITLTVSRKRPRAQSLELEIDNEEAAW
ncbi:hypothetical protein N7491_007083 [Penicillium cf. griseofulvum]|uniref:Uncharacterized protein n=1 Tax=Penicillium cf. griseofulvum TaxID=2972120 RepID=A0A9W9IWY0_9EURO|nr:hypothetical protein N7472_009886 [Penicillium cf. griseofulvum]KAJ5430067.1 hypothetical protein N7491_007083 [Penicillium cf. griseofulvum]KAJ5436159.1 hypothetical protein N7445_007044 [Penicillium cf. griseofulvum]